MRFKRENIIFGKYVMDWRPTGGLIVQMVNGAQRGTAITYGII